MTSTDPQDDVVFDPYMLRLVVGALAFAFPTVVIALTGKVTTSISASYHELETRDVFVGFLFIIGALLISYKGHLQGDPRPETQSRWSWFVSLRWASVYQEDIFSSIGGFAAIFTALYPTARDGDPLDSKAIVHTVGAFILFINVTYFCLIAFLRSLNRKLVDDPEIDGDPGLANLLEEIRSASTRAGQGLFRRAWNFLTFEIRLFHAIAKQVLRRYEGENAVTKVWKLLWGYERKFARGYTYVICGSLILLTLTTFLLLLRFLPGMLAGTATFVVETIALVFFGIAWITASQMKYVSQIISWVRARFGRTEAAAQPGAA